MAENYLVLRSVKIIDDAGIITPPVRKSIVEGWYEKKEADGALALIEPGERVMEIGSGIGFLSVLVARHPNTCAMICYEADPDLVEFSKRVHRLNGVSGVRIKHGILTNDLGVKESKLYVRQDFWGNSVLPRNHCKEEIMVPTKHFDAAIASFRPTMIVCDIEGGEVELFRNASLSGVRKIIIELHTDFVGLDGVHSLFASFGRCNFAYDQKHSSGGIVVFRRHMAVAAPYGAT